MSKIVLISMLLNIYPAQDVKKRLDYNTLGEKMFGFNPIKARESESMFFSGGRSPPPPPPPRV